MTSQDVPTGRADVVRSVHRYGRARAHADFTLGSDLPEAEVRRRLERCGKAAEGVDAEVSALLAGQPVTPELFAAIGEFSVQLFLYGSERADGAAIHEAVEPVLDALDRLYELTTANS